MNLKQSVKQTLDARWVLTASKAEENKQVEESLAV